MSDRLAAGSLEIERSEHGETLVVALRGELDLGSAPVLEGQLSDLLSDGYGHITVDLSHLEFMDSRGLLALMQAQQTAVAEQKAFSLRPGARQVQRLFDLTGLRKHFTFED